MVWMPAMITRWSRCHAVCVSAALVSAAQVIRCIQCSLVLCCNGLNACDDNTLAPPTGWCIYRNSQSPRRVSGVSQIFQFCSFLTSHFKLQTLSLVTLSNNLQQHWTSVDWKNGPCIFACKLTVIYTDLTFSEIMKHVIKFCCWFF